MFAEQHVVDDVAGHPPYFANHSTHGIHLQTAPVGGVPYLLFMPENLAPNLPPLVLVHGISRNAHQHLEAFSSFANETRRMLIAPIFDEVRCKRYQKVRAKQCRADQMLLAVLQDARNVSGHVFTQIVLYGFSGGAQFGHRFAMLHPEVVSRLAIASAGWYTFPDHQQVFPYGLRTRKGINLTTNMKHFLSIPMLVMVGELDIRRDANLRKGQFIDRQQGLSRVERAARWVRAIRQEADALGVKPAISFSTLPDSTHDFARCVKRGGLVNCVTHWLAANE